MTAAARVKFSAPKHEHGTVVRVSKCSRFRIVTRRYIAPSRSLGHTLYDRGRELAELDTLAEAREMADEIASEPEKPTGPIPFELRISGGAADDVMVDIEARASATEGDPAREQGRRALDAISIASGKRTGLRIPINADTWPAVHGALDWYASLTAATSTIPASTLRAAKRALAECSDHGWIAPSRPTKREVAS